MHSGLNVCLVLKIKKNIFFHGVFDNMVKTLLVPNLV